MFRVVIFLLLGLIACRTAALGLGTGSDLDPRFQPDQRIETDTPLGRFSVGVSGLTEHERLGSTTGDLEFGTLYRLELDSTFPRIAELRPFVFNRVESTETTYYDSLGVGVGMRASLREKYEQNNWFVRLSVLTPTAEYIERYSQTRSPESVVELFAGFEIPFDATKKDRDMRQRIGRRHVIRIGVTPKLFSSDEPISPSVLRKGHAMMLAGYLARVSRFEYGEFQQRAPIAADWPVLRLIEHATDQRLTDAQWLELRTDMITQPIEREARRQAIVADFLRRGLTAMMRGNYPLVFEPLNLDTDAEPDGRAWPVSVARVSRPGMRQPDEQDPLNIDAMIENYIDEVTGRKQ